ncbi:MAG: DNA modification methylase [Planctomycetes bacterium]|nr:DNA modification methylase [Planctomycetota bacterium]
MQVQRVALSSLEFWPQNARKHGPVNHEAIKASLKTFGQAEPLVVQASTKQVIGGNGRLAAMRELGWKECDVVELHLDDQKAAALGLALNRTSELASWDEPVLADILKQLDAAGELGATGFSHDDLGELLDKLESLSGDADLDEVPEPPDQPTTRRGDLWVLGEHRLLCGDSSSTADLDRLLAGAPIHLVNTDPPYNVKVEPRSNNAIAAGLSSFTSTHHQGLDLARHPEKSQPTTRQMRAKDRPLANDFVSDEAFAELLGKWFGNLSRVLKPGRSFFIWGGYSNLGNYPPALKAAGLYFSQAIVWNKEHPVLTRKDFMGAFELAYYGWKEGAGHEFFGPNNVTDLWNVKKVTPTAMVHLTEKPVELATRALLYSSRRGEHVLDLFGGSGSTLVACEQAQRRAFLMELDEAYCDVILERWAKLTGKQPVHEATGRVFAGTVGAQST